MSDSAYSELCAAAHSERGTCFVEWNPTSRTLRVKDISEALWESFRRAREGRPYEWQPILRVQDVEVGAHCIAIILKMDPALQPRES